MISYSEVIESNNNFNSKKKSSFTKKKIKCLFNFNPFQLQSYIEFYLKEKNISNIFADTDFDQIYQQINKIKKKDNIDILIVGNDFNVIHKNEKPKIKNFTDQINIQVSQLVKIKKKNPKLEIILFNLPFTFSENFKNNQNQEEKKKINLFNLNLENICRKNNIHFFDYNSIVLEVGQKNFYSNKNYYVSKSILSEEGCNAISSEISKLIRSIIFIKKKCLVLDLDNTLWGGILGEDGIQGIKISNSYEGEKYSKFQRYIKYLSNSGIILAIASKNNLSDVKMCFNKNKNLLLKWNDFSSTRINWRPKYQNINEISTELNIGKDSIVFFDDSKFERDQMKKFNPKISVISVPQNVDNYIESIDNTGFFYSSTELTKEDLKKKTQYNIVEKAKTFKLKFKSNDIEHYLKSLKMKLYIRQIKENNFSRCVQMLNKTNQFNFTTTRYTETTFKNYLKNNKILSFVLRLKDKFGDHGITGLITVRILKEECIIDNFLLSCRILGRNVEEIAITLLMMKLKKMKNSKLIGIYKKTQKNIQCSDFYKKLNFNKITNQKFSFDLDKSKISLKKIMKIKYE